MINLWIDNLAQKRLDESTWFLDKHYSEAPIQPCPRVTVSAILNQWNILAFISDIINQSMQYTNHPAFLSLPGALAPSATDPFPLP
jgi:hypothetical protein